MITVSGLTKSLALQLGGYGIRVVHSHVSRALDGGRGEGGRGDGGAGRGWAGRGQGGAGRAQWRRRRGCAWARRPS